MAGATLRQKRCNFRTAARLFTGFMKERCPTDCIEFVIVAGSVHVATGIEQRAHDVNVPVRRGPMERICVVAGLACVRIGTVLEQEAYKVQMAVLRRRV